MKIARRFLAVLILTGCFFPAAELRSQKIMMGKRTYSSLDELEIRYGMIAAGNRMYDKKRTVVFQADKRQFTINNVKYFLSYAPLSAGGKIHLAGIDIQNQLDPVLLPRSVPKHPVRHIVIDPGHGGKDEGARGKRYQEKNLTLSIAGKVRDRLVRAGYRVTMTRHTDIALTLPQRAALARALKADLFISIHINATKDPSIAGIETFALTPAGGPSTSSAKADGKSYPGNRCNANNLAFANMVHRYLLSRTRGVDRGVKRARFQVLREVNMPGVLVECGFISNAAEELSLGSGARQDNIARGIADAVAAYRFSIEKNPVPLKK